ncbi:hypothetical protein [Caulobacter vibrioides]|uniref:hypothetical protein n=1 Tax=Caulobacter vibrioides TaxID=155892 RepID=UPI0015E65AE1|nr:hypothetical protein [Caulobacter vibrioides]
MREAKQANPRRHAGTCGGGSWSPLDLVTVRTPEGVAFGWLEILTPVDEPSAEEGRTYGNNEFHSFPFMRRRPTGTVPPSDSNHGGRRSAR